MVNIKVPANQTVPPHVRKQHWSDEIVTNRHTFREGSTIAKNVSRSGLPPPDTTKCFNSLLQILEDSWTVHRSFCCAISSANSPSQRFSPTTVETSGWYKAAQSASSLLLLINAILRPVQIAEIEMNSETPSSVQTSESARRISIHSLLTSPASPRSRPRNTGSDSAALKTSSRTATASNSRVGLSDVQYTNATPPIPLSLNRKVHPVPNLQSTIGKGRRNKKHVCEHPDCGREFSRKSNLEAHR